MKGFNDFSIEAVDYELAAEYSNICRRNGIQGSNTGFLICSVSVRNNFEIFTTDDDCNHYKNISNEIILYKSNRPLRITRLSN
jgi:hypothetical protein